VHVRDAAEILPHHVLHGCAGVALVESVAHRRRGFLEIDAGQVHGPTRRARAAANQQKGQRPA
jgi:hypothetical protein